MESVLRSSPPPPTNEQSVCAGCQEILIQPDKDVTDTCRVTREGRNIVLSAERGCPLCKAFAWLPHQSRGEVCSCWEMSLDLSRRDDGPWSVAMKESGEDSLWATTFEMKLIPTTWYSSPAPPYQRTSFQVEQSNPSLTQLALPALPNSTSDQRCMDQASAWFKECSKNHKRCNQLSDIRTAATIPSRLLAISPLKVKIVATAHTLISEAPVYITVSHKWRSQMPKLLRCNIEKFERGVNVSELPQLFQDVFNLAGALKIPYVWIDALCIIQDDEADKASEISKMNHVYQNAFLNVGATGAADAIMSSAESALAPDSELRRDSNFDRSMGVKNDWHLRDGNRTSVERYDWFALQDPPTDPSHDLLGFATEHIPSPGLSTGLFADRDPSFWSPSSFEIKRKGKEYRCFFWGSSPEENFQDSALFKRGWVLQERLLSPRTLYFGKQIVWECSELVACEMFPRGFPWDLPEPNVRLGKILANCSENCEQSTQRNAWMDIVRAFTKCQLTYDSDFFPALSGLAHNFQSFFQDEYCAGLWKNDFISGLCWFRDDQEYDQYYPYPDKYRAPSWSWASVKFPVDFIDPKERTNGLRNKLTYIGRIEEIEIINSGPDPLGCISSARLQISGHLRKAIRHASERNIKRMPSWTVDHQSVQYEWFDTGHEGEGFDIRDMSTAYFLLLAYAKGVLVFGPGDSLPLIEQLTGVIVEPVDDDRTTWRRIGAFHHPRGNRSMERDSSPGYPEFDDWDPENYERHTITIV